MLILGIETSCDETAVAVVQDGRRVVSNVVFSSLRAHKRFGGVVPEIAVRAHLSKINLVLKKADVDLERIKFIAVTYRPGLIGALLIGVSFAKALAFRQGIPLIKIDHLIAHLYAPFLDSSVDFKQIFPAIGMVVSGGHTSLFYLHSFEEHQLLGQTRDDAAGEAFDKVAKILDLGYPGGPIIERLARKGDAQRIKFPCATLKGSFDFSFSGIKTAVLYKVKREGCRAVADICAGFQRAVTEVLVEKAIKACVVKKCRNLILGGGVICNSYLKRKMTERAREKSISLFYPSPQFSTDNAAMVAGLAYHLRKEKYLASLSLTPSPD
ncbi:MAG: tRNA (adenosine(37)-N6)-threonylcarbamoyltransferase complex transferase subunit TsaD [Candidatus Omnitrophota bacterium]|nr:MAG: tRNA (adenosine(37)-N6)-threonylcarbamoyltransferase complex transferase subunit TsaD [Candidatus Omnitrophota bacterium]